MDAAGAASARGPRAEDTERLLRSVRNYAVLLYVGTMVAGIAPRMARKHAPLALARAVSCVAGGYDVLITAAAFVAATVLLQGRFARALERRPAPAAPRLTPLAAWVLAVATWGSVTVLFLAWLDLGEGLVGRADWAVAGVASAANLAMACRTAAVHLA